METTNDKTDGCYVEDITKSYRENIEKLLKSNYVDNMFNTHVSMIHPLGKFQFNRLQLENLWSLYCDAIYTEQSPDFLNHNLILGIAEKPIEYLPVLVDIDIKVKDAELDPSVLENGDHLYNEIHLSQVIEVYQSILRQIVEDCTPEKLLCVVLEKPVYYIESNGVTYIKSGLHLSFVNMFLSKTNQDVHLIPRVREALKELETFADLGIEDSGTVIDNGYLRAPWLLYGCRKSPEMDPYVVTKVIDAEGNELEIEKALKNYRLYNTSEELIRITQKNVRKYLPRILSIIPCSREVSEVKHGLPCPLRQKLIDERIKKRASNTNTQLKISVEEALNISEKLLPMLADFRAEDRNEWMTIGWTLYSIGEGSERALDQWLTFSSRCADKYDEAHCIYQWEKMIKKDLSLGTLRYYASIDSPQLYTEFKKQNAKKYVETCEGTHTDIARILYAEYGTEFVCASVSNKTWFQFTGHRWEEIEEGVFLREKISNEVVEYFTELCKTVIDTTKEVDKAGMAAIQNKQKIIMKIITNLKSAPYKSNIMKEAADIFYDKRFKQKLDQNPYIIGFKNGVYDLKLNIFRAGRPEDFISKSMPIDYIEYTEGDDKVLMVKDFLEKVFPDKSVRQYFLDISSDVFVGGNFQKIAVFWTGEGDNGKSVTQTIFEKMLGDLAIKFETTLLTGKKTGTGSAAPELARAAPPVRWATLEEPDNDEEMNVGYLKKLTGNDTYFARDLFEKGKQTREITPMFKLVFIANKLPKLKHADKATWNRVRVVPFESTFVRPGEPCPETYEEQLLQKRFPMDKEFTTQKIPVMLSAFAWYLLEHRKHITVRIEPEKVKEATLLYRKQNDIMRQFLEECLTPEEEAFISLQELYTTFKDWYKDSGYTLSSIPIKSEIKEYYEKLWGEIGPGARWKGYRIRTLKDDIENGDAFIVNGGAPPM